MRQFIMIYLILLLSVALGGPAAAGPIAADAITLPEYRAAFVNGGGKLLLSDSPEMVGEDGILYQDRVEGEVRLFFYHVNATNTAKELAVVLENSGTKPARIVISRWGLSGPSYSWPLVGKAAITGYLSGAGQRSFSVPPGGSAVLAKEIGETAMLPNMLINGIYDFSADQPVTVKVLMQPLFTDSSEFARKAKVLAADEVHLRGTFDGANRTVKPLKEYDPLAHGAVALTLADNKVDGYLKGIDATDGSAVVNYGNYGVVYRIVLSTKTKLKFACYITPLGGEYAGAMGVRYKGIERGPVATPLEGVSFGHEGRGDYALVGAFEGSQPLSLTFSPPGCSNMPVRLVLVPDYYY